MACQGEKCSKAEKENAPWEERMACQGEKCSKAEKENAP